MNDASHAVLDRYSDAAKTVAPDLCCPVDYDAALLKLLPEEIIAKDYGCGDPSRYVRTGDTVLDLGSGGGKICYMAAQLVGAEGKVIGIDMNDDMLVLARKYQSEMARKLGGDRVRFVKGRIQDLALDLDRVDAHLKENPVTSGQALSALREWEQRQRHDRPLIPDASVDLVISNCVLNLVDDADKQKMVQEIFRVLKPGGRIAISDIVSDEPIPPTLKNDPKLWSGCIVGAFQELDFLQTFKTAGFINLTYDKWSTEPWQVLNDIEFRSVTLTAVKGAGTSCIDYGHAVIYKGPYAHVTDDEGHVYFRGERMAVCERTFQFLTQGTTRDDFIGIEPKHLGEGTSWCAPAGTRRSVTETKGGAHREACGTVGCC